MTSSKLQRLQEHRSRRRLSPAPVTRSAGRASPPSPERQPPLPLPLAGSGSRAGRGRRPVSWPDRPRHGRVRRRLRSLGRALWRRGEVGRSAVATIVTFRIRVVGTSAASVSLRTRTGLRAGRVWLPPPYSMSNKVSRIFTEQSPSRKTRGGTECAGCSGCAVLVAAKTHRTVFFCKL